MTAKKTGARAKSWPVKRAASRPTPQRPEQAARAGVSALHGTVKSGYAKTQDPSALPAASLSGAQIGRTAPAQRDYSKARYEVVTAEEAQMRMQQRLKGDRPVISGGLDSDFDALGGNEPPAYDPEQPSADDDTMFDDGAPIVIRPSRKQAVPEAQPPCPEPPRNASAVDTYLARRRRIELELTDTALTVPVVDVVLSRYGVTLLLPSSGDGGTFIPKPGSDVKITDGTAIYSCYFPGISFDLPQLHLMGLCFVRSEEG